MASKGCRLYRAGQAEHAGGRVGVRPDRTLARGALTGVSIIRILACRSRSGDVSPAGNGGDRLGETTVRSEERPKFLFPNDLE